MTPGGSDFICLDQPFFVNSKFHFVCLSFADRFYIMLFFALKQTALSCDSICVTSFFVVFVF